MDKSPDAFRTISEVADWLGTPAHVLRFWESRFSQVKPVKRAGGRRYYRPSDMVLLGGIKKLLHDDGMTIRGVQKLLREHGVRYVASMSPHIDGVDPVEPLAESVGPVPAAPMAENVPTGAFDTMPEVPEEKIVPFSRPDIPPQPAPNTAPMGELTDAPSDTPSMDNDAPEAPMIDVDAPFAPVVEPVEQSETHRISEPAPISDPASINVPMTNEAIQTTETSPLVPSDAALEPTAVTKPTPSTQVNFDFDSVSGSDSVADSTALFDTPNDTTTEDAPADDAAFETALRDALTADDVHLDTENAQDEMSDPQDESTFGQVPLAPAQMAADQPAPAPMGLQDVNIDPLPVVDETSEMLAPLEIMDDPSDLSTTDDPNKNNHLAMVPEDLEDDVQGLDVTEGVLGRLNKNALSAAGPHNVQAIFDRVMVLKAKLSQTG
ncbi:MAG: DNA-binding transcriptional MerR regulator [Celeribacter sp.]|jgi:DNA-binding transcriptional MerR regulator